MSHRIVYVIRHLDTGLHKIGITNNWFRRKRELEVGTKTTPVHVVRVNDARQVEAFLHRRFKAKRMPQSEWFALSAEQLEFVRATVLKARDDHRPQGQPAPATPPPPPPAAIVRVNPAAMGTPAPTPPPAKGRPPFYAMAAIAALLAGSWLAVIGIQQEAKYNAAKAAIEAVEQKKEVARLDAQQAAADQARLVAEQQAKEEQERMAEQAKQTAVIDMQQAALKNYDTPLRQVVAYGCRFYVHAFRSGDPNVSLVGYSSLADATPYDISTCSQIAGALDTRGDAGRDFIRDKVLREYGQLPPENRRSSTAFYSLEWPAPQ